MNYGSDYRYIYIRLLPVRNKFFIYPGVNHFVLSHFKNASLIPVECYNRLFFGCPICLCEMLKKVVG